MTSPSRKSLIVVALLSIGVGGALSSPIRAEDGDPTTIEAALAAVSSADVALRTWARAEVFDSDFRRSALEGLLPEGVPDLHATGGDQAGQHALAEAESRVTDIVTRMRRRKVNLVLGSAAPVPEEAPAVPDVAEESFDIRAFTRKTLALHAPPGGIPLTTDWGEPNADPVDADGASVLRLPEDRLVGQVVHELHEETATVEALDNRIVVRASPEALARVRALLARWKTSMQDRVSLDVRAIRITHRLFAELVKISSGLTLTGEAERTLALALEGGQEARILAARSVTGDDGATVSVRRGESLSYVSDHEVIAVHSGTIVDSVVNCLDTGLSVEVCPTVDPERKSITLECRADLSATVGPFAKEILAAGPIDLPEIAISRLATIASIPLGRVSLLGGSFADPASPDALAFVLYVKPSILTAAPERSPAETARAPEPLAPLSELSAPTKAELERLCAILPLLEAAGAKAHAARTYRAELLDVRDLFSGLRDQRVTRLGVLLPPGQMRGPQDEEIELTPTAMEAERLEQRMKQATGGDEVWGDPASYDTVHGLLIIRQTPGTLAAIRAQLAALRRGRRRPVAVEASVYRLDPAWLADLEAFAASHGGVGGTLPSPALARFLEAEATPHGPVVFQAGGFVLSRSGERTNVFQGRERAFVRGLRGWVSAAPPAHAVLPGVAVARTGLRLASRVREEDDGGHAFSIETALGTTKVRELARSEGAAGSITTPLLEIDDDLTNVTLAAGSGILIVRARTPGSVEAVLLRPLAP